MVLASVAEGFHNGLDVDPLAILGPSFRYISVAPGVLAPRSRRYARPADSAAINAACYGRLGTPSIDAIGMLGGAGSGGSGQTGGVTLLYAAWAVPCQSIRRAWWRAIEQAGWLS
jgi:hypothetical protein